jgi:phage tail sheath protein FI
VRYRFKGIVRSTGQPVEGHAHGETPDEAYKVRCDETTNPPDSIDEGHVVCLVEVAPATPMEFITLRLTLGADGLLEVVER